MEYATAYDVGERKRDGGINEDSVAISVLEQGHRDGYRGRQQSAGEGNRGDASDTADGGDAPPANRSVAVFALADGAGGYEAGDRASYIATTVAIRELADIAGQLTASGPEGFDVTLPSTREAPTDDQLRAAVEEAILAAHGDIIEAAAEAGTAAYTTIVAGIVADGQVHYGWVGDSRAYVVNRDRKTIQQLTRDHAVVERLRTEGEIDDVAATVHPRGNEITRAVGGAGGQETSVAVEIDSVPLYAEDVLLVTSDGLVDAQTDAPALYKQYVESGRSEEMAETVRRRVVTDDDIRGKVLAAGNLDGAARSLLELANERGGKDNLSVLLLSDPALDSTPADANLAVRDITVTPIEERETVVLPDE